MELHPAMVHFPIALSLTAVLLFLLSQLFHKEALRTATLWNIDLAALGGVAAVLSGLGAEESIESGGLSQAAHDLLETHGALGYAAGGILAGTALLRRIAPACRHDSPGLIWH